MPDSLKMRINDCIYGMFQKIYKPIYKIKNRRAALYIPVLAFHWFLSPEEKNSEAYKDNRWYASIESFEEQLIWLKQHGYYSLTSDQFYEWISGKKELPGKPVMLTFDDGEQSQLNLVVPLLKKYMFHGVCFVVGKHFCGDKAAAVPANAEEDTVTYFTKLQFEETESTDSVMEMQSHTYNLHYQVDAKPAVCVVSDAVLRKDLDLMQQLSFDYIAMPYGAYGKNTESILREYYKLGFDIDKVGNPYACRQSHFYAINRIQVDGRRGGDFLSRYLY